MRNINSDYFSWLAMDATFDEFREEISSVIERENNEWILNKTDTELREHMAMLRELGSSSSLEGQDEVRVLVDSISYKLGILRGFIDDYLDNESIAYELERESEKPKVVFAKNKAGNVIVSKHLKEIQDYGDDKYETVMGLFERLVGGDTDFNAEKQKPLTSSNKLKGVYELKDFQLRLFYMRENEYVVVIGACVKKDDNDLRYRDGVENMKKQSEKYRQAIRNGKLDMEKEMADAQEYLDQLFQDKKRGK